MSVTSAGWEVEILSMSYPYNIIFVSGVLIVNIFGSKICYIIYAFKRFKYLHKDI